MACTDLLPLCTTAAMGRFRARMAAICRPGAISSDSTSAYRNSATLSLRTPPPSSGLKRIHAPACSLGWPMELARSSPCLATRSMMAPAVSLQQPLPEGVQRPSRSKASVT